VLGATALQREVLVELLENRVHSPTVADRRRSNRQVSACVAARVDMNKP
jgi:hypothetical protein